MQKPRGWQTEVSASYSNQRQLAASPHPQPGHHQACVPAAGSGAAAQFVVAMLGITQVKPTRRHWEKLSDECGERLLPNHLAKQGGQYRYYISRGYVTVRKRQPEGQGGRLPADQVEQCVALAIRTYLSGRVRSDLIPAADVDAMKRLQLAKDGDQRQVFMLLHPAQIRSGALTLVPDAERLTDTVEVDPACINADPALLRCSI